MKTKADQVDMSPAAITLRLDDVRALYRLALSLGRARVVGVHALPHKPPGPQ